MSNTDKSVVSKPGTVITRWWWVRHAPVREDDGCIYGQKDLGCDTSDREVFEAVGKILPREKFTEDRGMRLPDLRERALVSSNAYALIWHRPLFDIALYVIVLGVVVYLSKWFAT